MAVKNLDAWKFIVQVFFSTVVVTLCVFKLASSDTQDNPNAALYWGGLTGILGYWLPSPSNRQDEDRQQLGLMVASQSSSNAANGQAQNSEAQIVAAQVTNTTE